MMIPFLAGGRDEPSIILGSSQRPAYGSNAWKWKKHGSNGWTEEPEESEESEESEDRNLKKKKTPINKMMTPQ